MRKRHIDCIKFRRAIKRTKITEGICSSNTLLYMQYLMLWAVVIVADYMLEFRFEYMWPFWLLLRSIYDSYKYKGLAFSVFFIIIAITSDLVFLFFIPLHWLLFAASTYVWVQFAWQTDKGVCLPTILLWILFIYLEAIVRWKESRHMPHLGLCRPLAAHCIGYPIVTLGFGVKSYLNYKIRLRKQQKISKENEFYMTLLRQSLPDECNKTNSTEPILNGTTDKSFDKGLCDNKKNYPAIASHYTSNGHATFSSNSSGTENGKAKTDGSRDKDKPELNVSLNNLLSNYKTSVKLNNCNSYQNNSPYLSKKPTLSSAMSSANDINGKRRDREGANDTLLTSSNTQSETCTTKISNHCDSSNKTNSCNSNKMGKHVWRDSSGETHGAVKLNANKTSTSSIESSEKVKARKNGGRGNKQNKDHHMNSKKNATASDTGSSTPLSSISSGSINKNNDLVFNGSGVEGHCDLCIDSQTRISELIQQNEMCTEKYRSRIENLNTTLAVKQTENDKLEKRINDLLQSQQVDRQKFQNTQKRLEDESRLKLALETELMNEKKLRKFTEDKLQTMPECSDSCRQRKKQTEIDMKHLRQRFNETEKHRSTLEKQNKCYEKQLRRYEAEIRKIGSQENPEVLLTALNAMQEKNTTLEKNLSSETRVKCDLFSALGEAKRKIEILENAIIQRENELHDTKCKNSHLAQIIQSLPGNVFNSIMHLNNQPNNGNPSMTPVPFNGHNTFSHTNENYGELDPNLVVYSQNK